MPCCTMLTSVPTVAARSETVTRIEFVYATGEPVRRQELHERIRIEKRTIDALGRCADDAVQANGAGGLGHETSIPVQSIGR